MEEFRDNARGTAVQRGEHVVICYRLDCAMIGNSGWPQPAVWGRRQTRKRRAEAELMRLGLARLCQIGAGDLDRVRPDGDGSSMRSGSPEGCGRGGEKSPSCWGNNRPGLEQLSSASTWVASALTVGIAAPSPPPEADV